MTYTLAVTQREKTGSDHARSLRAAGSIPGILYGAGAEPVSITLSAVEFGKVWREAGESSIVEVSGLPGDKRSVLIHDVAVDPIYSNPIHVDLYAVRTDRLVEVAVPLSFSGVAPAEKELGGTLIKVMHEVEIEALPKDLPHELSVDIGTLKTFDDQVHVRDLVLPQGVSLVTDGDEVVALVQAARAETVEDVSEPVDLSKIEVEKKGKEEKEEEEA